MKTEHRQILVLVVSFIVGLAAFFFTHAYLGNKYREIEKRRAEIEGRYKLVEVVVADTTLVPGIAIDMKNIAQTKVPRNALGGEPVLAADFEKIIGVKVAHTIEKGQPILWAFLSTPQGPRSGLSPSIRSGLRAVSISAGGVSAVSGLVQPNDRVDVMGTFEFPSPAGNGQTEVVTLTILQNVTVLATGTQIGKSWQDTGSGRFGGAAGYSMVTLQVTPNEAELLVFAGYMKGRLTLSLRNPSDISYLKGADLQNVNFEHLEKKIPEYNEVRQRDARIR